MGLSRCARCGCDFSAEEFKYEDETGRTVCERCFQTTPSEGGASQPGFTMLRAISVLLRVVALVGLISGAVLAHLRFEYSIILAIEAAVTGMLIFLACIVLSELLRLGLCVERELTRISAVSQRILGLIQERGQESRLPIEGEGEGSSR